MGTAKVNRLAAPAPNRLLLAVYDDTVEFALRFWRHARDSGASVAIRHRPPAPAPNRPLLAGPPLPSSAPTSRLAPSPPSAPTPASNRLLLAGCDESVEFALRYWRHARDSSAPASDRLLLAGYDESVAFALRYWRHAKDSGARRVGLVEKKLAAGADVANLP